MTDEAEINSAGSHFEIQYGVIFANGMIDNVVTKSQLKFEADLSIRSEVTACFSFSKWRPAAILKFKMASFRLI